MSELTDEIKSRVINAIRNSAHSSTPINIKDLDKFIKEAVKHLGKSGQGVGISQSSGGGASVTLTITGLKIPIDIMSKIARRYFQRQRKYLDDRIIPADNYKEPNATATGQTRGRMWGQDLDGNMELRDNMFRFQMPDALRSGDVAKRLKKIRASNRTKKDKNKNRKPKQKQLQVIDATKIQRGKRNGQKYVPPTYNDVVGYIEKRIGKPIFFTGEQEIKEIIVTELVSAMK